MTRTAYIYRRVSTGKQAEEGVSLDDQREQLEAYCIVKGWTLGGSFEDAGRSGRTMKRRPGLEQAIRAACACEGVLIVRALDRLTRSVGDADRIAKQFREARADLVILDLSVDTSTAHGECIFNIIVALAQLESRKTGERIAATHRYLGKLHGGTTMGRSPWGIRFNQDTKCREPDPARWPLALELAQLHAVGQDFGQLAAMLNERGVPSPKGVAWCRGAVKRVLGTVGRYNSSAPAPNACASTSDSDATSCAE